MTGSARGHTPGARSDEEHDRALQQEAVRQSGWEGSAVDGRYEWRLRHVQHAGEYRVWQERALYPVHTAQGPRRSGKAIGGEGNIDTITAAVVRLGFQVTVGAMLVIAGCFSPALAFSILRPFHRDMAVFADAEDHARHARGRQDHAYPQDGAEFQGFEKMSHRWYDVTFGPV